MGKYIKKAKIKDDLAVMDAVPHSQNSLGVRTRAKTLALQKLQSPPPSSYLQLRSRRLEKVVPLITEPKNKPPTPKPNRCENPSPAKSGSVVEWVSIEGLKDQEVAVPEFSDKEDDLNLNMEPSFGENSPDFDGKERSTRESTPCSLIRVSDMAGSATRQTASSAANNNIRMQNALLDIAITREIDQFFSFAEEQQRRLFSEKYNFDVVNDVPLPGRYEWVKVNN